MSDEQFEEFLKREAGRAYNPPPADVPRDEMFAAIRAARASSVTPPRTSRPRYAPWIGLAATLLVGIGIGRFAWQDTSLTLQTIAAGAEDRAVSTPTTSGSEPMPMRDDASTTVVANAGELADRSNPVVRAGRATVSRGGATAPPTARTANASDNTALRLRSQDHLARAEALVSIVSTMSADPTMDSLTVRWAQQMLGNTRLLLDSPAGDDPVRRRLLEDLETLLVQLVQRSGGAVDERALIDRTLERTQLLTRLRSGAAGI